MEKIKDRISEEIKKCPECNGKIITNPKDGVKYCEDCGLVTKELVIDPGPEWRAFDSEQKSKRARTGAPMTNRMHDRGLGNLPIQFLFGAKTGPQEQLRNAQRRAGREPWSERNFIFALEEIDRMASELKLPVNIREAASMLYRKAMKKQLTRGRSIEGITAAILYITCKQYDVPRSLKEITEISRVGQKEISRAYHFLLRKLHLKVSPASPVEFVPRFCSNLDLDGRVQGEAIEITKKAVEANLTNGRMPKGIAAAAIYIAAISNGEHRTQKKVANACGVTEVTIRNRYKEMAEGLEIDALL